MPWVAEVGAVGGVGPVGQDPAVDLRVQRDHPVAEHLGGAGDVRDVGDGDARLGQGRGGAAARQQLPAEPVQALGERDDPVLS